MFTHWRLQSGIAQPASQQYALFADRSRMWTYTGKLFAQVLEHETQNKLSNKYAGIWRCVIG